MIRCLDCGMQIHPDEKYVDDLGSFCDIQCATNFAYNVLAQDDDYWVEGDDGWDMEAELEDEYDEEAA